MNRMLIGSYLDEFGLTHDVAASGGAAVMSLAAKTYDLVLMDTAMRDLDGIETTQAHPQPARAVLASADRGADRQRA